MKIKELKGLCFSNHGLVQMAVLYNYNTQMDVATGSIEYIIRDYGEWELTRIQAHNSLLVLEVRL